MKYFLLTLSLSLSLPVALPADSPQNTQPSPAAAIDLWQELVAKSKSGTTLYLAACCKICRKGKACGDSCISRSYTCHKAPGCACDGS